MVASWYNPRGNASVNVNGLIPNIALERIEIVKDGASALYGSDAIAGVVNFITKKDFEGMDFNYQFTTDDESGEGDAGLFDVIWGVQGDRGGMVLSHRFSIVMRLMLMTATSGLVVQQSPVQDNQVESSPSADNKSSGQTMD